MGRRLAGRKALGWVAFGAPFAAVVAAVLVSAAPGTGVTVPDALPDLVSDPPADQYLQTYVDGTGTRLLLRFDGYVHNDGDGALELWGETPLNGGMTSTYQTIYGQTGTTTRDDPSGRAEFLYETADGHNHWHLIAAMRYGLFDKTKTSLVAPAMKVGFCLIDSEKVGPQGPSTRVYTLGTFCRQNQPSATDVKMGISPGWRDVYHGGLAFQWVDVSDVAPGEYWLGADSDPDAHMIESDETNNDTAYATTMSVVPGWVARAVSLARPSSGAVAVPLASSSFGTPGGVTYRIETAPTRGTLSVAAGQTVPAGTTLTYTPTAGQTGPDSFTYSARDGSSAFPLHPPTATVTLTEQAATVSVSGAPASMTAGTSAQLTALVTGAPPTVTWSVEGVAGGNATVGTISATGLYSAPASVPPGGAVRVRATSGSAYGEAAITITAAQPPAPAPAPAPAPSGGGGSGGAAPDLELTMVADRSTAGVGDTIVFRLRARQLNTVQSSGAAGTVITVALPAGLELLSTKVNRGPGCSGTGPVTCPLDFLSGSLVAEVELAARVVSAGTLVTTATLDSTPTDLDPSSNTATVTVGGPRTASVAPQTKAVVKPRIKPLVSIAVGRLGRQLYVTGTANRAGTVEVVARKAGMRAASCRVRTPGSRSFACAVPLGKGVTPRGIVVGVRLRAGTASLDFRKIVLSRSYGVARDGLESWTPPAVR